MTWYRVLKPFKSVDMAGRERHYKPGQLVDVINRHEEKRLLGTGVIGSVEQDHTQQIRAAVETPGGRRRIALYMHRTDHYSGGRVYLTQCGWALASMGNDVTLVCDKEPLWWRDYEPLENYRWMPDANIPDIDLIITEGKNPVAWEALKKSRAAQIPIIVLNFETPNWYELHRPDLVAGIASQENYKPLFYACDVAVAISELSRKYLAEWLGDNTPPIELVRPAINDFALMGKRASFAAMLRRPYCVVCGRADQGKNIPTAIKAVFALDEECDIAVISRAYQTQPDTGLHKIHHLFGVSDAEKYSIMAGARLVLAPSDFEGFGLVPGEAIASGTPCVAYDLPVLREEYKNYGDYIRYSPRGDVEAFKRAVAEEFKAKKSVPAEAQEGIRGEFGLAALARAWDAVVPTERISISAVMNLYNNESTVAYAIESVYPHVDEIIIAYGREPRWEWQEDGSLDIVRNYPDPEGKIKIIVKDPWPDDRRRRVQQRECAARMARGNYLMILDADEIWTGLDEYKQALSQGRIEGGTPLAVNFWHDDKHCIYTDLKCAEADLRRHGVKSPYTKWGAVWPHFRLVPWRASHRWTTHIWAVRSDGDDVWRKDWNYRTVKELKESVVIWHLGHALEKSRMSQKKNYYSAILGQQQAQKAWEKWRGQLGKCDEGYIEKIDFPLPDIIKRAFESIRKCDADSLVDADGVCAQR